MKQYWVKYEALGTHQTVGPYLTRGEAELHCNDITGFEGVSNSEIYSTGEHDNNSLGGVLAVLDVITGGM